MWPKMQHAELIVLILCMKPCVTDVTLLAFQQFDMHMLYYPSELHIPATFGIKLEQSNF